jgi:hypothetical protein
MSNEFSKFVAGLQLQARAAASRGHKDGMARRGSPALGMRARRLRALNK